jgi:hypothetical protein
MMAEIEIQSIATSTASTIKKRKEDDEEMGTIILTESFIAMKDTLAPSSSWSIGLLLYIYGSIPWNDNLRNIYYNSLSFTWFVISKLSIAQYLVYILLQWIAIIGDDTKNTEKFELASILYFTNFAQNILYVTPPFWNLVNPLSNRMIIADKMNKKKSDDNNSSSNHYNFLSKQQLKNAHYYAITTSIFFFIYSLIFIIAFVIVYCIADGHTSLNSFGKQELFPILTIGNVFSACAQSSYIAIFVYRSISAEYLITHAIQSLTNDNLISVRDVYKCRKHFRELFGDRRSKDYLLHSAIVAVSILGSISGVVRICLNLDIFGFLISMCLYGRCFPLVIIVFRHAGRVNSLCDKFLEKVAMIENPDDDVVDDDCQEKVPDHVLRRSYIATNLQAIPLSITLMGIKSTTSTYKWQLSSILITLGLRLLQALHENITKL